MSRRITLPGITLQIGWRPIVPVVVYGPARMFIAPGYVDSGADRTHLSYEYAESLGIERAACEPIKMELGGVTQQGLRSPWPIRVNFGGYCVDVEEPVVGASSALLIGRDVFAGFAVTFDARAGVVHADAYPETNRTDVAVQDYRRALAQVVAKPNPWVIGDLKRLEDSLES